MTEFITLLFFGLPIVACAGIAVVALVDGGGVRTLGLRKRVAGSIFRNPPPPDWVEPLPDIEKDPLAIEIKRAHVKMVCKRHLEVQAEWALLSTSERNPESSEIDEALKKLYLFCNLVQCVSEENGGLLPPASDQRYLQMGALAPDQIKSRFTSEGFSEPLEY